MGETRDPHIAIMDAYKRGRGLCLTADEVWSLAQDSAIETRAAAIRTGEAETITPPNTKDHSRHAR